MHHQLWKAVLLTLGLHSFDGLDSLQVTGGRNGYGAKLTNIFSTEFVVETCDGQRGRRYKQVTSLCCMLDVLIVRLIHAVPAH